MGAQLFMVTFRPFSLVWGAEYRADFEDLVNLGISREQRPTNINELVNRKISRRKKIFGNCFITYTANSIKNLANSNIKIYK